MKIRENGYHCKMRGLQRIVRTQDLYFLILTKLQKRKHVLFNLLITDYEIDHIP